MPELPEVEVTRRSFVDRIRGARVAGVHMGKPLRWPLGAEPEVLLGQEVQDVRRRGKYLLLDGEAKTDGGPGDRAVTNARDVLNRLAGADDVCLVGLYAYNPPAILQAVKAKQAADLHSSTFNQFIISEYLKRHSIDDHIAKITERYGAQAKAMVAASQATTSSGAVSAEPSPNTTMRPLSEKRAGSRLLSRPMLALPTAMVP